MRLEALGSSPVALERSIRRAQLSGGEAAAALAAPPRSLGFQTVTVLSGQPPAT